MCVTCNMKSEKYSPHAFGHESTPVFATQIAVDTAHTTRSLCLHESHERRRPGIPKLRSVFLEMRRYSLPACPTRNSGRIEGGGRGGHSAAACSARGSSARSGARLASQPLLHVLPPTRDGAAAILSRKRLAPGADGEQGTASRTLVDTYMHVSHALHQHTSHVCRHARDDASSSPRVGARRALSQPGGASLNLERFRYGPITYPPKTT